MSTIRNTRSTSSVTTDPFPEFDTPTPGDWELGDPKWPDTNIFATLYGPTGARIDLKELSLADYDTPVVLVELYVSDPPHSPAYHETTEIAQTPEQVPSIVQDLIRHTE